MNDTRLSSGVSDRTFGREPSDEPAERRAASGGPAGGGTDGPISYELASWGVRASAYLIDAIPAVLIALGIVIGAHTAESDGEDARRLIETLVLAIGVPFSLLYAPLLMIRRGARNGQTLGKQAMRIRVVREDGKPVTIGNALLREVIGRQLLVAFTYGIYAVLDYLWPTWDRARQCLHDKVAQTRVVLVTDAPDGGGALHASGLPARPHVAPAPAPPPRRPEDDRPVRGDWLPPARD